MLLGGGGITGRGFHRQQTARSTGSPGGRAGEAHHPVGRCPRPRSGTQHQRHQDLGQEVLGSSAGKIISRPFPAGCRPRWTLRTDQRRMSARPGSLRTKPGTPCLTSFPVSRPLVRRSLARTNVFVNRDDKKRNPDQQVQLGTAQTPPCLSPLRAGQATLPPLAHPLSEPLLLQCLAHSESPSGSTAPAPLARGLHLGLGLLAPTQHHNGGWRTQGL